jgi:hypothetical protein
LQNEGACVRLAGRETHRTWVLYLAGCAHQFETGCLDVYQTLLARRSSPHARRLTREYMYDGASARAEGSGHEGAPRCADVTQGEPVITI